MRTLRSRRSALACLVTVALASLAGWGPAAAAPIVPKVGMVCAAGTTGFDTVPTRTFDLVANTGQIHTPDGNTVFMWSYSISGGAFQSPGPVLCANQGEDVIVNLTNSLPRAASIIFPGQDAPVTASGGAPGLLTREASALGGTVSYRFSASAPGTYLYESGSEPALQIQMGLYGALIIRPTAGPDRAYADTSTQFDPNREYLMLLAEIDPEIHHAIEVTPLADLDLASPHYRYFTINGRSFPDTIQDNGSALLPTQPYGALVRIQPTDPTNASSRPALIRMINAGADNHPFHPHGNHTREIAQDGRPVVGGSGGTATTEHFAETIGAGQTLDYLLRWDNKATDTAGDPFNDDWGPVANPLPVPPPNYLNVTFKDGVTWYSGSPYLGYKGTFPTGTTSLNVCGEWYFPLHSHALNEFTNFDEGFGGMGTLLRVDPAGGCFASPTSTRILAGTLSSGSVSNLAFADALYYKVNSTAGVTDWYSQFSAIPAGSSNFKVSYQGNNVLVPYTQNFSTLAVNGTSSTLPAGWAFVETGGNTTYGTGNGSSAAANTYSFGAGGSSERAFGTLRGTSLSSIIGVGLTNTTGQTIDSVTVTYTGEEWRRGVANAATPDRLDFQYSTNATSLTTGAWTPVAALNFSTPVTAGGVGAVNGNASANRSTKTATIAGLSIAPNATYWLRWTDFDRPGADDGLAVDDVSISVATAAIGTITSVSIWNWATSSWVAITGASQPVGATDVVVADKAAPVASGTFLGTGSNKGLVRVRVYTTESPGTAPFITGGNFMQLVYDAP